MNEINIKKYDKIEEIRETIRTLYFNLGDLVDILRNENYDETFKDEIERNAWKVVEKIKEIVNEHVKKE